MDNVCIRQSRPDDFEKIYQIELDCYDEPWSETEFFEEFHWNKGANWFVAECDEEIVGFAGIWSKLSESHIVNLAVLPKFRKQGIAKKLVSALIFTSERKLASKYIFLEVRVSNKPAVELYKSFGFRVMKKMDGYYVEDGESALLMIKEFSK